jgi:hypothetical protein
MVKLEDFVSETLKQIVNGVRTAQDYAMENGASINPSTLSFRTDQGEVRLYERKTGRIAQEIDFDIAVTTTEGTKTKGGIGIFVGPVGLGSQGQLDSTNSSMSRIKFKVPMLLPAQIVPENE